MDEVILLWLNHHDTAFLDALVPMLTYRFAWIALYAALAVAAWRTLGARQTVLFLASVAVAIVLADQIGASVIRPLAERPRPTNPLNPLSEAVRLVGGYRGGPYGMPSCHAANSVALLTVLLLRFRSRGLAALMAVWVAVQVWTRMYLGVHYPTDLLAGAAVGFCSAWAANWLFRRHSPGRAELRWTWLPVCVAALTVAVMAALAYFTQ